ncbi:MAG TPA: lamin tail domain-containing protein [Candidatus Limnocylindrales bacterium]
MGRARRFAFSLVLVLVALAGVTIGVPARPIQAADAAAVGWPTSTLVLSEIVTGGASASDEFVELENAGTATVDLAGLEVVYATSSGSTVTRRASWSASRPIGPGQHLLIANAAGSYAALADGTYDGGLAATGGAVALRVIGGSAIDAIGWGDATNAFVEGSPAPAPAAGSSLERLPGGGAGDGIDTNENAHDWSVRPSPSPQNLASPPSPTATSIPAPSGPMPSASPAATVTPGVCGPSASPTNTPGPGGTTIPSILPTPRTTPTVAPTVGPIAIVDARALPIGAAVRVRGTVTAEAGRLGSPALLAIADETAGIVVHLPVGASAPPRGSVVEVTGPLAAPYGQLEVRPPVGAIVELGPGTLPEPVPVRSSELGEAVEGGLVSVDAVVDTSPSRATNGSVTLDALDPATRGRFAIRADASSGIATADLPRHARVHLVGLAGQRATRAGRLDGYRIWLRDRADIVVTDAGTSGSPTPSGTATAGSTTPSMSIAQALLSPGVPVRVAGTVTAAGRLVDANGRVVVIQDATAAIAVRLPTGTATPRVGVRLRVDGRVGRSYGAPRIAATVATGVGTGTSILPLAIRAAPGTAHEWRLVRVQGIVVDVRRLGDRWRAEIAVGAVRVLVSGLPGARVPASALIEGRQAIVIGIVRRPYPSATDRRFAIVPRAPDDVRLGAPAGLPGAGGPAAGSGPVFGTDAAGAARSGTGPAGPLDVDLATLTEHRGEIVRVGGIVTAVESGAFLLDDGTGIGRIALSGEAATYLGLLAPGDALDAIGRVGGSAAALAIDVTKASDIVRVGDPGTDPSRITTPSPSDSSLVRAGGASEGGAEPAPATDPTASDAGAIALAVVGCAALSALAAAAFALRRRRDRRVTSGRIALRLAAFGGGGPDEPTPV